MTAQRRQQIDCTTIVVRRDLQLDTSITSEKLCQTINKFLPGKCLQVDHLNDDSKSVYLMINEMHDDDLFKIRYLVSQPDEKTCFLIARELGHLFLHILNDSENLEKNAGKKLVWSAEEMLEADEFATAFMIPEEEFIDVCRTQIKESLINVSDVTKD